MIDWNSSGRLFHSFWPLKVNARWPAAVLQSGICRRSLFLVLQLCTSDLVLNFWQRYGGASPFKHLNTMVASLTSSCLTIGSHCNCLRIGVTWSNFLVPETIRAAKFCTVCNSSMFFLVVLAHTDEQYNNLLNTRELIIVINVRLSNRYFTPFIWQRLPIHFEVNWVVCSSYVKLQSIVTTKFFADLDDVISMLSRTSSVMLRSSGSFITYCRVPRTRSFVFSGLMSRLFLQHHVAMFIRSSVSWAAAKVASVQCWSEGGG